MANTSSLADQAFKAAAISDLVILVTPNKQTGYQPQVQDSLDGTLDAQESPILFHYEAENVVTLDSDITDHFVEDNSTINDQISLRPEMITVTGFIGELNNVPPVLNNYASANQVADKLYAMSAYQPALSIGAQIAYNNAQLAYNLAKKISNAAINAFATITGTGGQTIVGSNGASNTQSKTQTKQQQVFTQFYGYWRNRRLFTIQTPWAIFQNCAIKTLKATQDESTRMITDFEVTFKVMRFASTKIITATTTGAYDYKNMNNRAFNQASPEINIGPNTPILSSSLSSVLS